MQKTTNYGFPKPEDDDFFNVKDFADMMDKVDETLAKVENAGGIYVGGTNLSTEATINDEEAEYPVLSKNASSISEITLFSKKSCTENRNIFSYDSYEGFRYIENRFCYICKNQKRIIYRRDH